MDPVPHLSAQRAVRLAVSCTALVLVLDLLDDHLGWLFAAGFCLVVIVIARMIELDSVVTAAMLPVVLLPVALAATALFRPSAIDVEGLPADAGRLARFIGAIVDHGVVLAAATAVVLAVLGLRSFRRGRRP